MRWPSKFEELWSVLMGMEREGLLGEGESQQHEYPPRVAFGWIAMWCSLPFEPKLSHPTLAGIRKFGFAVPVCWLR